MRPRAAFAIPICLILLLTAVFSRISVGGSVPASAGPRLSATGGMTFFKDPVIELRAQRAATGIVVGAALAIAGACLQCLFRNPLASPDLLGMASGAGLGVVLASYLRYVTSGQISEVGLALTGPPALMGALGALFITYLLSQRRGFIEPASLLLVGVIVGVLAASATVFVQHLLPDRGVSASRWLLGAIGDDVTWRQIALVGLIVLILGIAAWRLGPWMDAASLGDDEARSLGVPLGALRTFLFIASGVLAAASVVLAGPVAFIGLICPHLIRMFAGPGHRRLILGAALAGAALVVGADTLVRAVELRSGRLPIGVLTSLIGGPLLILLLRDRGRFG